MELKKGINLGGFLSQCEHSLEHYKSFLGKNDIKAIADWGMDHVRLPIDYEVLEQKEGYALITSIVEECENYNLNIILDLHKAPGYDFTKVSETAANTLFTSEENPLLL